jgi:hypothetical protein
MVCQESVRQKSSMLLVVAFAGVALFFSACGKGGSSSSSSSSTSTSTSTTPAPATLSSGPPTVSLSVSPQSVVAGQSATLTWTSTDATSVTITPTLPAEGPSGTFQTPPLTTTTTYTATATGTGGTSAPASVTVTVTTPLPPAALGVYTHKYDNTGQGANLSETILTPANVNSTTFGKLFTLNVDGAIYGQPLIVPTLTINGASHNVVYVATEHDSVYAFDADGTTTAPLWKVSFLVNGATTVSTSGATPDLSSATIYPEIGITSTPVIDPTTSTIYVVAETLENGNCVHRLHALDLSTGAEKPGSPVVIQASVAGTGVSAVNGQIAFSSIDQLQRPALTLYNGLVLIGFGSQGDNPPWHGWVLAYNAATLKQSWQFNVTPNGTDGGIWMAGGGFVVDALGGIYFMTANGTFGTGSDYGDSFVRMNSAGQVVDYFTPNTELTLEQNDLDLGSGGPLILPDQSGPNPHLIVGAGKDTNIYLVNRDNMGKFDLDGNNNNQIVQELPGALIGESRSQPAYWNGFVYFSSFGDAVKAFAISNGQLSTTPASMTPVTSGLECDDYPVATCALSTPSPTVSANGTSNGILWLVFLSGGNAGTGTLYAYDATNLTREFYDSSQVASRDAVGTASKFAPVTVVNGKVYVAALNRLLIYGLLN